MSRTTTPAGIKRRAYFAERYKKDKAARKRERRRLRAAREREASKVNSDVVYGDLDIASAEHILAQPLVHSRVTWLELSSGRSNT